MKLRNLVVSTSFLLTSVVSVPSASAHAALESTVPAKGAIVSKTTSQVSMLFGEDILVIKGKNPNSISVTDSHGKKVSIGVAVVSGTKISNRLKSPLATGKYTVKYRVVSADGHVVSGSYTFTVK
jgi:methionine-rich copper-binding protein CopC